MKKTFPLLILLLFVASPMCQAQDDEYKRMPWHLVDLWWDIGEDLAFESYSIDVKISEDLPDSPARSAARTDC